ncbi:MAG TPA: amino acid adenylation domain-containing protein [Longimicrobium sp.]
MDTNTTPRSRDRLSEAKRLLLEKRIRGEAKTVVSRHAIRRVGGGPVFPMSYGQERLWFLDQMEPGNPFYNIPMACLISARVDVPTLERAFTEIITRHEALRTVYRLVDGEPRQIVQPPHPVRVDVHDMRGPNGEPASDEAIRARIAELGARPFDIANGPLLRVDLIRVSEADSGLLVNVHHIATDGWSMPIVTREMEQLYEAIAHGRPSPLQPLEIQYADYSLWQRDFLTGDTLRQQVDYWRGHLQGAPVLQLPTDRPRPPVLSYRGTMYRFVWPAAVARRLHAYCVEAGASMNMVIMAGFYLMLHRYSGQDDLVVGTLLGNRNRAELEQLVGFLVNSAPIRARVRPEMTFRELVGQVRTAVLNADANQDLPFDKIVDAVGEERDPSRSPLFQVMFFHHTFVNNDVHHLKDSTFQSELNLRALFQETGVTLVETNTTKFDLSLATLEYEGSLVNACEYSTDMWDEATIARMMEHCRVLLERGVAAPDAPLSSLSMVADDERGRLLAWGVDEHNAGADGTLVQRFEAQAARAPQAPALEYHDASWTYAQLDARANQVARRLLAMGVRPGDPVGLAAGPSAAMVAALVGILKAGAAVAPLDPEHPAERLVGMMDDARIRVVVTERGEPAHALRGGIAALDLANDAAAVAAEDAGPLPPRARPESVAYLAFTSGSTGQPKASMTQHRALVRTVVDARWVQAAPGDRVAQASGLSFDGAVVEVWLALANGATVVGVERDVLLDSAAYARALRERRITMAFLTTPLFNRYAREVPAALAGLRHLAFGGEAADPEAVRACLAAVAPGRLLNMYGPAENVILATAHEVRALAPDAHTVPIGVPVDDTRCYVLDPYGLPCGTGVPGEMFIGGGRVSAGYVARPRLTAERFVPDPFSPHAGARMYRTGDRVRWTEAGELEFLERMDAQVKVRGFRIEPGEVEAALRAHPAVRECVVAVREDAPGDRRLVAYLVERDGAAADAAELRGFLKQRLPDYMVPSAFVALDAIPLTPNDKVDFRALPAPGAAAAADRYEAPRTPVEQALAALWAAVLRMERVGIHDNFFALGGDSILSIQIIARAAEQGIRILPRQMFTHQTIAELAAVATSTDADAQPADAADDSPFALAGLDDDALDDLLSRMG